MDLCVFGPDSISTPNLLCGPHENVVPRKVVISTITVNCNQTHVGPSWRQKISLPCVGLQTSRNRPANSCVKLYMGLLAVVLICCYQRQFDADSPCINLPPRYPCRWRTKQPLWPEIICRSSVKLQCLWKCVRLQLLSVWCRWVIPHELRWILIWWTIAVFGKIVVALEWLDMISNSCSQLVCCCGPLALIHFQSLITLQPIWYDDTPTLARGCVITSGVVLIGTAAKKAN